MYFLRSFDPWKGKHCSCGPKYSLAPYTGCDHKCLYCYITTYIPHAFNCRPKADFLKKLPRDLEKADNNIPISIANSSDPYPTIEKSLKLTRNALKILAEYDFKVLLVTKSDIFLRDLDILAVGRFAISSTINTIDDKLAEKLEPGAPSPSDRISALEKAIGSEIPVMVRVDPIVPGLNEGVEPLLKRLAESGVQCITTSTYKARIDSMNRLTNAFPKISEILVSQYSNTSSPYINRARYLPLEERNRIMKNVSGYAKKFGLKFNMCREGIPLQRTAPSCDGTHLLF